MSTVWPLDAMCDIHGSLFLVCQDGIVCLDAVFREKTFVADHEVNEGVTDAKESWSGHDG